MEKKTQKRLYELFGEVSSSLDKINDLIRLNNLIKPEDNRTIEWYGGELSAFEWMLHLANCSGGVDCEMPEPHEED